MTKPVKTLFNSYFKDFENYDEVLKPDMTINKNWETLLSNVAQIGADNLSEKQIEIDWLLAENGVTYNVYNDPVGLNRPWNLNTIPFIINQEEWYTVEEGLKQRAELLNLVLNDIYGDRKLIKDGIVPPEIIFAHRNFLRNCDQIKYKTAKQLLIHSADLARGPDGRMWVVNDRAGAPSGMGYALENRFSTSLVVPELFKNINVKQPFGFFKDFNQLLINASPNKKESPTIVILTPGPHNETYFEHTYLSSYLGYQLVKGNDLVVRDNKVWMKTLKSLIQVDVILRRVDDAFTDPLELRGDSFLGVAGLLNVVRLQNVAIVNPIGSAIIENPGLIPFMNSICRYFLNEDLKLPQIASWWCGQERECQFVLKNLKRFVVKPIDRTSRESIYFCEFLSDDELIALKKEILSKPYKYVAQEKIYFSTAPNLSKQHLEPRKVMCRTFAVAKNNSYSVMPGGLVRVAPDGEKIHVSNQRGGTSKDFWVTCNSDIEQKNIKRYNWSHMAPNHNKGIENLASHTAENLFWSGRYIARTLVTARYIRVVLNEMINTDSSKRESDSDTLKILFQSISHITSIFPGFTGKNKENALKNPLKEIEIVLFDKNTIGSLANSIAAFGNSYHTLRNLWSKDMWRVFDSIKKTWESFNEKDKHNKQKLTKLLDNIITKLIAFMGLMEESILVEQGLLLYFIGLQIEQATMSIEKSRALLIVNHEEHIEYDVLESFLNSHESLNIYRYSFKSYLDIKNVINLVLLDKSYTRSLNYQLNRIRRDINKLPVKNDNLTSIESIEQACNLIQNSAISEVTNVDTSSATRKKLDNTLATLSDLLHKTSMAITNTYFNHSDQQKQLNKQNLQD